MNGHAATVGESSTSVRRVRTLLLGVLALTIYLLAVNIATTQYVADHYGHHPLLGEPVLGGFYSPLAWFHWQQQYLPTSRTFFLHVYVYYLLAMGAGFLVYVLTMGFITRSSRTHAGIHGSARFADSEEEIRDIGLLPPKGEPGAGVYVGAWTDPKGRTHYLRHDGPEHIGVIAPTRSGKGVSLVVPTLLSWGQSVVINDMKGELCNLTSGWRAKHAGNLVLRFEPAALEGSISINPLSEIRLETPYEVGDAQNIANIIVDPQGKGLVDHWAKTAHAFLTGCLLHLLYQKKQLGQQACLYDLAFALSDPSRKIDQLYEEMLNNQCALTDSGSKKAHPEIAAAARDMLNRPDEERGSVLSTAMSFLSLYRDPIVRRHTSNSTFRISDLMNADTPVSLYLIVGAEDKDRMRPLMRLILNQIVRVLLRPELTFVDGRPLPPHKHRLLLMLDEFPSYGKLEVFQEALAYIAAYDIKAYLIMQDVAQLWAVYGRDETIISNLHLRVAFAPNKLETAEWLSKMTGTTTVVKEHISTSGRRFGALLQNVSRDYQEQSRALMTPDEIMRLKAPLKGKRGEIVEAGEILVFAAGFSPIRGKQSLYFLDRVFLERSRIPASAALTPTAVSPSSIAPPENASATPGLDLAQIKAEGAAGLKDLRAELEREREAQRNSGTPRSDLRVQPFQFPT